MANTYLVQAIDSISGSINELRALHEHLESFANEAAFVNGLVDIDLSPEIKSADLTVCESINKLTGLFVKLKEVN